MMRKLLPVVLVLLLVLPLSGCWGKREVDQLGFVLALGIDAGTQPGHYQITYQMAKPGKGGDGGEMSSQTLTVESFGIRESIEQVYEVLDKEPFVGTVRIILIGEEAAQAGINQVLDFMQRYYEFRRTTYLILAEGKAQDILNLELREEKVPALALQSLTNQGYATSVFPTVRLGHYLTVLGTASTAPVLPVVHALKPGSQGIYYKTEGEEPAEMRMYGAGVFAGDKLATYLTDQETKGFMWLNNEVEQRLITSRAEEPFFGARVTESSTEWKVRNEDGQMLIHYTIKSTVLLNEYHGTASKPPAEFETITDQAAAELKQTILAECQAALAKSKELKLDFLGIGRHIESQQPKYWREIKEDWETALVDFPVVIDVEITIDHTGSSINAPTNPVGKGQE